MQESDSGATVSVWMRSGEVPRFQPLGADAECDVCVVGAGISGLTTAYLLAKEGRRVVVLDDGFVGGGETQRTTAHLASYQDDGVSSLEKTFGEAGARLAVESHAAAVDTIERIVRDESIDCGFARLDGWLFRAADTPETYLDDELAASERAGLEVELLPRAPLPFDTGRVLRVGRQAQFDITRYLAGLARAVVALGGKIHDGTHVEAIEDGTPCTVKAKGHVVKARDVVVATNSPVNDWVTMHTKQAPYRTYVVAFTVPVGTVTPGLYWDTGDPYHYVRLQHGPGATGTDTLIVGGEDHKTGQESDTEARFRNLERWTRMRFPVEGEPTFRWSGQVIESADHLAFIGRNPGDEHVHIITGDSGQGMTHGTIGGLVIRDLVLGRPNAWTALYDPSRKTIESVATVAGFAKENLNVAAQYRDWLTPGDVDHIGEIAPGTGALLRRGLKKIAAYKDEQGEVHLRSAVCPHLQCIVDWNPTEKSWDCPCHGSRFDCKGHVLNGPSITDLPPLEGNA